jgi:drug/metabolite transporter (DMT)-like permease
MRQDSERLMIVVCFAVIYLIWGSTYLAIRVALEGFPPFFLAGSRFLGPGILLYWWLRARGTPRPADGEWWWSVVTGAIMLVGASGALVWGEQVVPSAVAALLFTTVPLWMIVLEALVNRGALGGWRTWSGLVLGLSGVALLVSPSSRELLGVDAFGALVILFAALSWASGSIVSRRVRNRLPRSPLMTVAVQMMAGGSILYAISGATGEWRAGPDMWSVTPHSVAAVLYLGFVGALFGLSAYTYLLQRVSPAAVSTYAFVNPVIAVLLGWLVAAEPMGPSIVWAAGMIVVAVVLIQSASWRAAERLKETALERAENARAAIPRSVAPAGRPACRQGES